MLETGSLEIALKGIVGALFQETGVEMCFSQSGTPRKLPALTEHNLLRIGQEALANAFKHSCAKKINVTIEYEPNLVRLSIHDDGRGFDIESAKSARHGHFGLLDMRERAEKISGKFSLTSHCDGGTNLAITVLTTPTTYLESNRLTNGTLSAASNGDRNSHP
jgi:signal transduction histidine kinase